MRLLHTFRFVLVGLAVLAAVGLILPFVMHSRTKADTVVCKDHLRELGLVGLRHASLPGESLPVRPREEVPPGAVPNADLPLEKRLSWYAYVLNAVNVGVPTDDPKQKHRTPTGLPTALESFKSGEPWDAMPNSALLHYRLKPAICPATAAHHFNKAMVAPASYVAIGGLGAEAPTLPLAQGGAKAGAFRFDGPTPDSAITDGLEQTAQIIETNVDVTEWLKGGRGTLRTLDPSAGPHLGVGRPFGGCHPGGCFVSMADGSVRFVKESVDAGILQAMFTRAGGAADLSGVAP